MNPSGLCIPPPPNSPPPPPNAPPCPGCCTGSSGGGGGSGSGAGGDSPSAGDPVSCASGLFLHTRTDVTLPDTLPLELSRTYRPGDTVDRPFGLGTSHPYALHLYFPSLTTYATAQLVTADGNAIDFTRISAGTNVADAVFESTSEPSSFFKSRITFNSNTNRWLLKTKDGAVYEFNNTAGLPLVAMTDRYGNALTFIRSGGLIQRILTPNGRYVDFTYDSANRITQLQDHAGRTVNYLYTSTGHLQRATYPDASNEEYTYDTAGRLLTVKDRRGNIMVRNVYDTNGRVTQQTLADGGIFQFAYTLNTDGQITRTDVTDPRGTLTRYEFSAQLLTRTTVGVGTPLAQTTTYVRHPSTGLVTARIDPLGRRTEYTYDASGNTTRIVRLAGTPQAVTESYTYEPTYNQITRHTNALGRITTYSYDTLGNLTEITNPLGYKTRYTYNNAGQPLTVTDPLNNITRLGYDLGDLISLTDPLGRVFKRYTDSLGRLTVTTDPLGNRTLYAYDAFDRLLQTTDARGQRTQYGYDPLGNLLTVTDANGGTTLHTYDAKNRLITRTADSQTGAITRAYDSFDRLTQEISPTGQLTYTYDVLGRRTGMTVAGQPTTTYTYDNANRLTQITQGSATVKYTYDAASRRTRLTLPNGITTTYAYNAASQLTGLTYAKPDATVLGTLTYTYNALGLRTATGGTLARTTLPPAATAVHDLANRATRLNATSLTYDANGNLLNDGTRTYTWDAKNRLTALNGPVTASFQYDALGRRLSKTLNGATTAYLHDGLTPVQELSGTTPTANLLTGLGIDDYYRRTDPTGPRDFLTDALGSVIALTDSLAQIKTEYTYAPYGETTRTGEANANPFQYTGRENDGTGLYYYRARYYSPGLQRFVSWDPIGLAGGLNTYAYVEGNPVSFIDPLGLAPEPPIVIDPRNPPTNPRPTEGIEERPVAEGPKPRIPGRPSCSMVFTICMVKCPQKCPGPPIVKGSACGVFCMANWLICKLGGGED